MAINQKPEIQIQDVNPDFSIKNGELHVKGITQDDGFIVNMVVNLDNEFFALNKEPKSEYLLINSNKVKICFRYKEGGIYKPAFVDDHIIELIQYDHRYLNAIDQKAIKFAQQKNGF
jgi:hypothetical protein